jgi:predicted small metal-binding protein
MKTLACRDVGLDCNFIIKGETEEKIMKNAIRHYWETHAIKPEEMISEMKVRIKDNIRDISPRE